MRFSAITIVAAFTVGRVAAHGGVLSYTIDGKWYDGWKAYNSPVGQTTIQRPWDTFNPILDPTSSTLSCNDDGASGPNQLTAQVRAGGSVTAFWNTWPHDTGPVLTYLAQCPGSTCTGVNSNSLKWFKIDEAGLLGGTVGKGQWAAGAMIANNNSWTTTIPSTVPSGHYLIRFETIALHSMPAQFYPECAQIEITNGGNVPPSADQLVTFPGAYKASDPGVTIDLYSNAAMTQTTYVIPGPRLYGSGSSPQPTTARPTTTSTSVRPTTTSAAPTTTAAPGGTVAHYGQCGGQGYSGPTTCAAPYTCSVINPYYSQCI